MKDTLSDLVYDPNEIGLMGAIGRGTLTGGGSVAGGFAGHKLIKLIENLRQSKLGLSSKAGLIGLPALALGTLGYNAGTNAFEYSDTERVNNSLKNIVKLLEQNNELTANNNIAQTADTVTHSGASSLMDKAKGLYEKLTTKTPTERLGDSGEEALKHLQGLGENTMEILKGNGGKRTGLFGLFGKTNYEKFKDSSSDLARALGAIGSNGVDVTKDKLSGLFN